VALGEYVSGDFSSLGPLQASSEIGPTDPEKNEIDTKFDKFEKKLKSLINELYLEFESSTPDFVLAKYLRGCLEIFNETESKKSDSFSN